MFTPQAHLDLSQSLSKSDLVIVGAGFFGSVIADVAARVHGLRSTIIEQRPYIGGNAFSFPDPTTGIEVHKYGSHLFHTANERVIEWVSNFVKLNGYVHRVFSTHANEAYSLPINLHTISQFYGKALSPREARELLKSKLVHIDGKPNNLYEKGISTIGPELFHAFFEGYTKKQWQQDPRELPADVISRLPVRFDFDSRYFSEEFQGVPIGGYGKWFELILQNPLISTFTSLDFFAVRDLVEDTAVPLVFSGPIDKYFHYAEGRLGWRTVDFEWETHESLKDFQGCSVMNFADAEVPYTRVHEFRHLHPEAVYPDSTVIAREFSRQALHGDEPYYPINTSSDRLMLERYRDLANLEKNVVFGGRLGSYKYLDMHMAIGAALTSFESEILPLVGRQRRFNKG